MFPRPKWARSVEHNRVGSAYAHHDRVRCPTNGHVDQKISSCPWDRVRAIYVNGSCLTGVDSKSKGPSKFA